jgi:hypothetical protein
VGFYRVTAVGQSASNRSHYVRNRKKRVCRQAIPTICSQVTREHYYQPDFESTAGRVVLRRDRAERQPPRRVDYLLRYTDSFPNAVIEAKEEGKSALSGLQ